MPQSLAAAVLLRNDQPAHLAESPFGGVAPLLVVLPVSRLPATGPTPALGGGYRRFTYYKLLRPAHVPAEGAIAKLLRERDQVLDTACLKMIIVLKYG